MSSLIYAPHEDPTPAANEAITEDYVIKIDPKEGSFAPLEEAI